MKRVASLALVALTMTAWLAVEADPAWAAVRGSSGGGTGSDSAPARPSSSSHLDASSHYAPPPARLWSGVGGVVAGGLLGRMLFGEGGTGVGLGLVELLLGAGGLYLVLSFFRHARATTPEPAYATAGAPADARAAAPVAPSPRVARPGTRREEIPALDRAGLADAARALFVGVQSALVLRDMGMFRNRLTPEMHAALQARCDRLRAARQSNHIEKIDITDARVEDAWRERKQEFATVRLRGTLFDYTLEDASGTVLEGSRTDAQSFEERWTFTRPAGTRPWRLAEIDAPVS